MGCGIDTALPLASPQFSRNSGQGKQNSLIGIRLVIYKQCDDILLSLDIHRHQMAGGGQPRLHRPADAARPTTSMGAAVRVTPSRALLVRGFATNVTNPKALLFYMALLSQFVATGGRHNSAALLVSAQRWWRSLGLLTDCAIVCSATMASGLVRSSRFASNWLRRIVAAGFIGMGLGLLTMIR